MVSTWAERIEYFRLPEMPGVEVLHVDRCVRCWRVVHETYAVRTLLETSGALVHWVHHGTVLKAGAGSIMLMEPGDTHVNPYPMPSCDFRILFLAPSLVEAAANDLALQAPQPGFHHPLTDDPEMFSAYVRFHRSLESDSTLLERESHFTECLRFLLRRWHKVEVSRLPRAERAALLRVRDLIRAHHARSIRLDELVAAAGLTRYHLVRAFKKEFGLPPHAYQIGVRIEKARDLLARGDPPARIASELGFTDQSHFSKRFRQVMGITPRHYQGQALTRGLLRSAAGA